MILYQCHDLHYLRLRRKAQLENDKTILEEAERYEKKEDFIFANSDALLTIPVRWLKQHLIDLKKLL